MPAMPYLTFVDQCRNAMTLYQEAFGARVVESFSFRDAPADPSMPIAAGTENRIMQAVVEIAGSPVRMSDSFQTNNDAPITTSAVSVAVESELSTIQHAFKTLSDCGTVIFPLAATFFSPGYASVIDRFGIKWELSATQKTGE